MKQNTYFISDLHLGAPSLEQSQQRERKVVDFLKSIEDDCATLFIVGDLFDYWFEYKRVVPRGHTRLLGTLANMAKVYVIFILALAAIFSIPPLVMIV